MSVYDSLIDCFGNCDSSYPAGPSKDKCYEVCLDMAENLLKLGIEERTITTDEAELLRELISNCKMNISKVEPLKDYCTNKYGELHKARSEAQIKAGTPNETAPTPEPIPVQSPPSTTATQLITSTTSE